MKKSRQWMLTAILTLCGLGANANDGVFYVNGNHLVPVQETDITLAKEVLTISLGDDGYASVDVKYELNNPGTAKTVVMGFEACAPYNDDTAFNPQGIHPYISDFTVHMNGEELAYKNAVVKSEYGVDCDFQPLNLKEWKAYGEVKMRDGEDLPHNALLYSEQRDSLISFAYAYYFVARFQTGRNTVHHTYRYRMSYGVGRTFEIPYWLKPAMRWANRQIDDFTLRIKATDTAKHFFLADSLFRAAPFCVTEGCGKMRKAKDWDVECMEFTLRNGTVEWHSRNFKPRADITIQSAERINYDHFILGTFYDRSEAYMPGGYMMEIEKIADRDRILRNLPYAHRGYVFKDKKLRKYFSQFWWYMPDANYQPSTADFTPREWKLIKEHQ